MSLFAIVPAAGLSRRMGQPKLVMDLYGEPVISRLLTALKHRDVVATTVVFRKSDFELSRIIEQHDVLAVQPEIDPPDMRCSVEHGLKAIEHEFHPQPNDGWLLIPADHPVVDRGVLDELIPIWQASTCDMLVPVHQQRRGHPTVFRWSLIERLGEIPADQGLNWLRSVADVTVQEVEVANDGVLLDLDTPADFAKLQSRFESDPARPEGASS
jgi:molybdenum cofactor cytidylyltransferase